nr:AMP-binding protein [Burkholderiales bacterium]
MILCGNEINYFETSLFKLFMQTIIVNPHRTAIIEFTGANNCVRNITFAELNERVNFITSELLRLGAKKNDRVIVALPRSIELIASILALLKLELCYCPIDTKFPENYAKRLV